MLKSYKISHGTVNIFPDRVETVYDDGVVAVGEFQFTDEDRARARALGYSTGVPHVDMKQMHMEHDLLHSIVAEAIGKEYSAALHGYQTGTNEEGEIPLEERIVFLVQRTLNIGRNILEEKRIS